MKNASFNFSCFLVKRDLEHNFENSTGTRPKPPSLREIMEDERFDGLFMNVANQAKGIEPLLDNLFSFLRRKTDFFVG